MYTLNEQQNLFRKCKRVKWPQRWSSLKKHSEILRLILEDLPLFSFECHKKSSCKWIKMCVLELWVCMFVFCNGARKSCLPTEKLKSNETLFQARHEDLMRLLTSDSFAFCCENYGRNFQKPRDLRTISESVFIEDLKTSLNRRTNLFFGEFRY